MQISQTTANIRAEMSRAGRRQIDIAEHLGMSQGQISTRLNDQTAWRVHEVQSIAAYLGISVKTLINDDGPATVTTEAVAAVTP
ncbi:helix-turn-helix domain-containing protein [Kineosporia succinea]|uniref:Transcriptional regulator with XRE-family HTH domain n=1 Tax=Kineosporia succinea TaxID=84632 RepID=A0ABT9P5W2_9ACTN|nr:helix-turn-helix transcriptional regulator [Kineosporia succinea]MDP9828079.1 transcriptional regulator with XRE-family HTH domain [Kineosporia succinea]